MDNIDEMVKKITVKKMVDSLTKVSTVAIDFQKESLEELTKAAEYMVKLMYHFDGICLAAPQIGISAKMFVMRTQPENFACYNPKIVHFSDEKILLEEANLSYPTMSIKIERPIEIRVRFNTPNGELRTEKFTGITARAFQQSMDVLDGIDWWSKATSLRRNKFHKDWKQMKRKLK